MADYDMFTIPPVNWEIQDIYMAEIPMQDPSTGEVNTHYSTPLRWLFRNLSMTLYLETLTEIYPVIAPEPEASCPVCFEEYNKPVEEMTTTPESGKASKRQEKPVKLKCGHVFGIDCLYQILDPDLIGNPTCPLCRNLIDPMLEDILLSRKDNKNNVNSGKQWDILGVLCCAIKLFLMSNRTQPETYPVFKAWVRGPAFESRRQARIEISTVYRDMINKWDEWGNRRLWNYIKARREES